LASPEARTSDFAMAAGLLAASVPESPEWHDLARLSEELRLAVCKIQAKLTLERQSLAAQQAAAAIDREAAAAERERAERLVKAAERIAMASECREPAQGAPCPEPLLQRPARREDGPVSSSSCNSEAPPMPHRSPPPSRQPAIAAGQPQAQLLTEGVPGAGRVKAPPMARNTPGQVSQPLRVKEPPRKPEPPVASGSSATGPSSTSSPVLAEVLPFPAKSPGFSQSRSGVPSETQSLTQDEDSDGKDDLANWAAETEEPPDQAPPPESPYYRVVPPPPKLLADPESPPLPPPANDESFALSENWTEQASPLVDDASQDGIAVRAAVKAMPGRASGDVSTAVPVGKAAASRYKAPPSVLSQPSPERREPGSEAPSTAASPIATPSRVKAPPSQR